MFNILPRIIVPVVRTIIRKLASVETVLDGKERFVVILFFFHGETFNSVQDERCPTAQNKLCVKVSPMAAILCDVILNIL